MSEIEKFIGESPLIGSPTSPLRFRIAENAVTTSKIADKAVSKAKLADEILEGVSNIETAISTLTEGQNNLAHEIETIKEKGVVSGVDWAEEDPEAHGYIANKPVFSFSTENDVRSIVSDYQYPIEDSELG